MLTKERQDIELSAQRATLEEQRTHINILDKALMNAQETVVQLEDEVPSVRDQYSTIEINTPKLLFLLAILVIYNDF